MIIRICKSDYHFGIFKLFFLLWFTDSDYHFGIFKLFFLLWFTDSDYHQKKKKTMVIRICKSKRRQHNSQKKKRQW
jgi:hypothetical protein